MTEKAFSAYLCETRAHMMLSLKKSLEETVLKLRNTLLKEEGPVVPSGIGNDTQKQADRREKGRVDMGQAATIAKNSAATYGDKLSASDKIRANDIIVRTITKGETGAVDATFINDLDARKDELDTPKTIAYDYIIQTLAMVYATPEGQSVEIGGQQLPVTSSTKENVYNGLLVMFNFTDRKRRWPHFIYGSFIKSTRHHKHRPRIPRDINGKIDYDEMDNMMSLLNSWLTNGGLRNLLTKTTFYQKGFATMVTSASRQYFQIKRDETKPKKAKSVISPTPDKNINTPTAQGFKKNLAGKTVSMEDPGVDNMVNSIADDDNDDSISMADFVAHGLLRFAINRLSSSKPHVVDLVRAKVSGIPNSLNSIVDPEYAEMYPYANKFFAGKDPSTAQTYLLKAYQGVLKSEAERLMAQYIKTMGLDMKPMVANDKWKEKPNKPEEKPQYKDYANPTTMTKRVKYTTDKSGNSKAVSQKFNSDDDYLQSLEETNEKNGDIHQMATNMLAAIDKFFLSNV